MTLWLKYLHIILIFGGAKPHLLSDAYAEHTRKELMRMRMHQLLTRMLSARISS